MPVVIVYAVALIGLVPRTQPSVQPSPRLHRLFPIRSCSLYRGVFLQSWNPLKSNASHAVTYSRPKRIMTRIGDWFFIKYKLHTDNFSWQQRRQGAYRISLKVELFKCSSMALQSKNCFSEYLNSHPIPSVYSIIFHQIPFPFHFWIFIQSIFYNSYILYNSLVSWLFHER